ncbi:fatty acid desaturase family protein [Brevibacterium yomogidense]|uniref:fatty acid desaturase family protein n=1 Tax=Brevibacterium yomogidense TaxID=946573 RepID=UPI000B354EC4|nr:acyl-CoA desaturase [Brevibacterium yomogidense]
MPASAPSKLTISRPSSPSPITSSPAKESGVVRTRPFPPLAKSYLEVSKVVRAEGLLARTPWFYALIGAGLILGFVACGVGFVLLGDSWFQLLIAAALGILFTQVAFLAHEAAHRTILSSGRANDRLSIFFGGVVGMSYSWWDSKHSRHHANPNKVSKDPDIAPGVLSFVATDAAQAKGPIRWLQSYQGWLFFPLLTLEGLNLHVQGIRHLCSRGKVKHRWIELTLLAIRFPAYLIPLFMFLPLGMAFAFLGVQLAVFGVYMGASFAPNHKGMPVIDHSVKLDFFSKQVRMSRNIRGGWWATWFMGGLNYQIEHHLFPSMPRRHLARTRRIVIEKCRELGVPYTETGLLQSYGIVIGYLNRVGLAARDPFDCPMMAEYRRG